MPVTAGNPTMGAIGHDSGKEREEGGQQGDGVFFEEAAAVLFAVGDIETLEDSLRSFVGAPEADEDAQCHTFAECSAGFAGELLTKVSDQFVGVLREACGEALGYGNPRLPASGNLFRSKLRLSHVSREAVA